MALSPLLKSGANLTKPRGRRARPLRRAYYGSLAAFSTKPVLYPGQGANFNTFLEGIFGGGTTYYGPGGGSAVTYANRILQFPTDTAGGPGVRLFNYNSANWTDLATLETAGSKSFLIIGWLKYIGAQSVFQTNVFNIGNGGLARTDPKTQIHLALFSAGFTLYVAGQAIISGAGLPVINTVNQIAILIEKDAAAGTTTATLWVTPLGSAAPVRAAGSAGPRGRRWSARRRARRWWRSRSRTHCRR